MMFTPSFVVLAAVANATEAMLLKVLIQLAVIIAVARIVAMLGKKLGQPAAVGEIAAGLMLGPSLLGWVWPGGFHALFPAQTTEVFVALKELGLVLLLFLIGLEFDYSHLRRSGHAAGLISLGGMVVPFVMGCGLAHVMRPVVAPDVPELGFVLFIATAISITALPILGRMLIEMNLTRTKLGAIAVTAAAIDDALGWVLLATVAAVVKSGFDPAATGLMLGLTVAMAVGMAFVVRPILLRIIGWSMDRNNGELSLAAFSGVLTALMLCAIATSLIGIFALFGAFMLGAVLAGDQRFARALTGKMSDFVSAFFLPIFFAYTGLRTEVGAIQGGAAWTCTLGVIGVAVIGKFGGCAAAARVGGLSWRQSLEVGSLMNARALMELIAVNLGYDMHVVPKSVFCMLVLMALVTTVMTTPVVLLLGRGDAELRPWLEQSEFAGWFGRRGEEGEPEPVSG